MRIRANSVSRVWCLGAAALALCAPLTAAGADGAADEYAWIWKLLGRLHPVVVHFPIALLLAALVFEILPRGRQKPLRSPSGEEVPPPPRPFVREGTLGCLILGAIGAGVAAWFGWLNADIEGFSKNVQSTVDWHRWLGIGVAGMAGLAALLAVLARWRRAENLRTTYRLLLVLVALSVPYVGHLGGTLVYGSDYYEFAFARLRGDPPAPPEKPAALPGPANPELGDGGPVPVEIDYVRDIQPIFAARCVQCHGPEKRKGRLRLDSLEEATARESVVQPGEPGASALIARITLPPDHEDFMPAEGEPLTADEIARISAWILSLGSAAESAAAPAPAAPAVEEVRAEAASPSAAPVEPAAAADSTRLSPEDLARRDAALAALRERGAIAAPIAAATDRVDVDFSLLGEAVTDADLALLEGLEPALEWLDLGGTAVTDEGVAGLARFPALRRLQLQRTQVTDACIASLQPLGALEVLNLFGTKVTDAAVPALEKLPALKRVYLWQTQVTRDAADGLRAARPGLAVDLGAVPTTAPAVVAAEASEAPAKTEAADAAALPPCCAAAVAKGGTCDHPCCVEAAAKGEICAQCSAK